MGRKLPRKTCLWFWVDLIKRSDKSSQLDFEPKLTSVFRAVKEPGVQRLFKENKGIFAIKKKIKVEDINSLLSQIVDICIRLWFRNLGSVSGPVGRRSSYGQSHWSSSMSPWETSHQDRWYATPYNHNILWLTFLEGLSCWLDYRDEILHKVLLQQWILID